MIKYKIFESCNNVVAFTTEKSDNLPDLVRFTGDNPAIYTENRRILSSLLGLQVNQFVFPRQTHSSNIAEINEIPYNELTDIDALITNKSGICICVQTADCVPVILFDPVKMAIGVVHSGWRGTVKQISKITVRKMNDNYGTNPDDLLAVIGPSIGPQVYEVGPEIVTEFSKSGLNIIDFIRSKRNGRSLLDLWNANLQLLIQSGVNPLHIELSERCSFQESNSFYSARRDGSHTGRIVTGIFMT